MTMEGEQARKLFGATDEKSGFVVPSPGNVWIVGSVHSMRCARSPSSLCVIAERAPDRKQLIFTAFDPMLGRGRELARFDTNPTPDAEYMWDLSPDGTRIAILKRSEAAISVLSLSGQPLHEVVVKG